MEIIKGLDEIRKAQTIEPPKSDVIRLAISDYTSGWVTAIYNRKTNKWSFRYFETREEAIADYESEKKLCEAFPEVFNWNDRSEMYVYRSIGYMKAKWALTYCIRE